MRRILLAVLFPILMAAAPSLSDDEAARLAAREVVVRVESTAGGAELFAFADVAAPPGKLIDAVIDFPPRVDEVGPLSAAEVYFHEGDRIGVRFEVTVVGTVTKFHVIYTVDRAANKASYTLDTSKPNDMIKVQGVYEAIPQGSGSRLVYRSSSESETSVPDWLKNRLSQGPLLDQVEGIRKRAER